LSNVELRGGYEALRLLANADRSAVVGARAIALDGAGELKLAADLVVDPTGRGNRGPTWLAELGYEPAREEEVRAGVVYATREYRRTPLPSGKSGLLTGISPQYPYGTVVLADGGAIDGSSRRGRDRGAAADCLRESRAGLPRPFYAVRRR
jgi:hypothetical protein